MDPVTTIDESEFRKVCDDLYRDREGIFRMCTGMGESEAVLWILYGSLLSLLDIPSNYSPDIHSDTPADRYFQAVCHLLQDRALPPFDCAALLEGLLSRLDR